LLGSWYMDNIQVVGVPESESSHGRENPLLNLGSARKALRGETKKLGHMICGQHYVDRLAARERC
jgi:hypothetical protein